MGPSRGWMSKCRTAGSLLPGLSPEMGRARPPRLWASPDVRSTPPRDAAGAGIFFGQLSHRHGAVYSYGRSSSPFPSEDGPTRRRAAPPPREVLRTSHERLEG